MGVGTATSSIAPTQGSGRDQWDFAKRPSQAALALEGNGLDTLVTYVDDGDPFANYQIGIYGWRKRFLYFVVILIVAMVIINVALTVWLLRVLDFNLDGIGRLRIVNGGIRLEGTANFLKAIYASEIRSRSDQPLKIQSSRNISFNARDATGRISNRLYVGDSIVEAFAEEFLVHNPEGKLLFRAADGEVSVAANSLRVTGPGGVTFDGSVQTPLVRADAYQQLKLESPTRELVVQGPEGVLVEAKSGDIAVVCDRNLSLSSNMGSVVFDTQNVFFQNLRTPIPASTGSSYSSIYQLCVCESGKLFLAVASGHCQSDEYVCHE